MDLSKLTKAHVFIIGLVVALILGVAFFFLGPQKTRQNLTTWNGRLAAAEAVISTEDAKKKALEEARQEVAAKQALWSRISATKMPKPPIDLSKSGDREQMLAMIRLWNEPRITVPLMEKFALDTDDVIVTTNFGVPGQPTDPRAIPQQQIEWNLGTITVSGTFQNILKYMKRWNNAPRVVAVDGFSLSGQSPFLTASANITVYIFPIPNPAAPQQSGGFGGGMGYGGGMNSGGYGGPPGPGGSAMPGDFGPGAPPGGPPGASPGMPS
jgi:hypothetical protein